MFALASNTRNTPQVFFPAVARGHGGRKYDRCSNRACQLMKDVRGVFSKEHVAGQVGNYDKWLNEREFGERVEGGR